MKKKESKKQFSDKTEEIKKQANNTSHENVTVENLAPTQLLPNVESKNGAAVSGQIDPQKAETEELPKTSVTGETRSVERIAENAIPTDNIDKAAQAGATQADVMSSIVASGSEPGVTNATAAQNASPQETPNTSMLVSLPKEMAGGTSAPGHLPPAAIASTGSEQPLKEPSALPSGPAAHDPSVVAGGPANPAAVPASAAYQPLPPHPGVVPNPPRPSKLQWLRSRWVKITAVTCAGLLIYGGGVFTGWMVSGPKPEPGRGMGPGHNMQNLRQQGRDAMGDMFDDMDQQPGSHPQMGPKEERMFKRFLEEKKKEMQTEGKDLNQNQSKDSNQTENKDTNQNKDTTSEKP